jgi:hypothetical protein
MKHDPGIGATDELSLRVSIATLVRVVFQHPHNDERMLALERKATLHQADNGHIIEVKSQPFGGAIRIRDLGMLRNLIGGFRFDSELSCAEQDFRIFIRPSDWSVVREFCLQHINSDDDPILETDPTRELAEEFADALKINLQTGQYISKPVGTIVEDDPSLTENIHARDIPTVRVYRIFETHITDASLARTMMKNSASVSHQNLCELALDDFHNNGNGWANAILVLPLKRISDVYLAMPPEERNTPIMFEENKLDETIPAVLENITVPKYQRL